MQEIKENDIRELINQGSEAGGCVSIYMPTHRKHPENQQDPIRFKNLAKTALEQLQNSELFTPEEVSDIENKLSALESDREFWNHRTDGLAWLFRQGKVRIFEFQRPVPELVVVSSSLHIKPLIRIVQTSDRYHVLALTRHTAELYAGTRDAVDKVELDAVPATMQEVLGEELTDPHLAVASYGGSERVMHHGHGSKTDEVDKDRDRYFRAVAEAVEKNWSNPTRLPIVLVALEQHHAPYHKVSSDKYLLDQGVSKDPSAMSTDEIRSSTWEVMRGYFDNELAGDIDRLNEAAAQNKGSSVITDLVREASNGRIELLLLEEDGKLPGKVNWDTGEIFDSTLCNPKVDDVLDDVAEMVIGRGGSVRIVRSGSLQSPSKIVGIFRY